MITENKSFRIVFMGTPDFAVHILSAIHKAGFCIPAVVTAPDKPAGRGQLMHESSVKVFAKENSLKILQPISLKDPEFVEELKSLNANLFVVVAFRMLPEVIWSMPPMGTINLHASLLPNYRGAAPINWAVINGETETGVTTFFIEKEIDTGKIIEQEKISIGENDTAGIVHDRLMELGAKVTISTINKIVAGEAAGKDQNAFQIKELKSAPKIFREDCKIDWNKSAIQVHNHIRGLSPYPSAWTYLKHLNGEQKNFKILSSHLCELPVTNKNELLESADGILFPCTDFYIKVTELQPEGKKKMDFKSFLAGNKLKDWHL